MKIVNVLLVVIIALLSIAAGLAKLLQAPQEMEFLRGLGLSPVLIIVFGLVQVVGGILLGLKKARLSGAVLVTAAFLVSTALLFMAGNISFGLISLVPVVLASLIIFQSTRASNI